MTISYNTTPITTINNVPAINYDTTFRNTPTTGTDYTTSSNYMTDTTAYPNNPYANDPNWICIYDRDAGIDIRDEYILDTSCFINEDIEQMYIDKTVIAARSPEPVQLSERELLKFLEEE